MFFTVLNPIIRLLKNIGFINRSKCKRCQYLFNIVTLGSALYLHLYNKPI